MTGPVVEVGAFDGVGEDEGDDVVAGGDGGRGEGRVFAFRFCGSEGSGEEEGEEEKKTFARDWGCGDERWCHDTRDR